MTASSYATTEDVLNYLNMTLEVPDYDNQVTDKELVGTADGTTTTVYYLDHNKVIDGTQIISYGLVPTSVTNLTETTHYTFNNDRGSFTLTSTGASSASTAFLYAEYKYNIHYKDSVIQDLIEKNTNLIDGILHKSWQERKTIVREEQTGRGNYSRVYKLREAPANFTIGQLLADVTSGSTAFSISNTSDLIVGDYLTIEDEVVGILDIVSTTQVTVMRGLLGSSAAAHTSGKYYINVVVEISNTRESAQPIWYLQGFRNQFDVDSEIGAVQLLHINARETDNSVYFDQYPSLRTFNRVRITYNTGGTVPEDIKTLCILMTAKDLFNSQIMNALARGTNGFTTDAVAIVDKEIDRIIKENYRMRLDGW